MSHSAQSAFLKLLEEPGTHITFILSTHQPSALLPTIRSRLQQYALRPVTSEQTSALIQSLGVSDPTKQTQLRYLAEGLPAEITRLARDNDRFKLFAGHIGDARQMLQGVPYQRALVVQKYRSDRSGAVQLVDAMIAILRRTMSTTPQQSTIKSLGQLLATREHLASNCNVSIQLMQHVL
jgi:DNA polymerase-3 subunit delta'